MSASGAKAPLQASCALGHSAPERWCDVAAAVWLLSAAGWALVAAGLGAVRLTIGLTASAPLVLEAASVQVTTWGLLGCAASALGVTLTQRRQRWGVVGQERSHLAAASTNVLVACAVVGNALLPLPMVSLGLPPLLATALAAGCAAMVLAPAAQRRAQHLTFVVRMRALSACLQERLLMLIRRFAGRIPHGGSGRRQ